MRPKPSPERASTNDSLDEERQKTDQQLATKRAAVEAEADDVVRDARKRADAVLQAAREAADHPSRSDGETVQEERARGDAAVVSERATEDRALKRERLDSRGGLEELFKLERDTTDLHLLTERARSDEDVNTRDTFLAMVCHDLRTMLSGISLTAAVLIKEEATGTGSTVRARAERIQRLTARMGRLVGDLVDVATIETGRPLVQPEGGDLKRLLREADEGLHSIAASKQIAFTTEIVAQPRIRPFDHDRILQVLANLITNAIKFTPEGGRISLRVEEQEGAVRFSVHDTGPGIPADKLQAIFERFWQVTQKDRRGLGLGLYISKCIVEGHGGRIWAENLPGGGATVSFTLPADAPAPPPAG